MVTRMKIVVPTYNSQGWVEKCLKSISVQTFKNWECIVINDASTDLTARIIDSLDFVKNDVRFSVQHNASNTGALNNIVTGFNKLNSKQEKDCVLMAIDGDDFLFSEHTLATVARAYEIYPDTLLTYGNWIGYPDGTRSNCRQYPASTVVNRSFRYEPFVASHLRTFKSKLWYKIKDEDLIIQNIRILLLYLVNFIVVYLVDQLIKIFF